MPEDTTLLKYKKCQIYFGYQGMNLRAGIATGYGLDDQVVGV
jgi:hypothetical protein